MTAASLPRDEKQRLDALRSYEILDTPPEAAFDRLTAIASQMLKTPIALVSLVDAERQWFKSSVGLDATETTRDWAFCAHAIHRHDEPLVVSDATADVRFRDNPLVTGDPKIRFYAGAPIVSRDGYALGTVCAIDRKPRADISASDLAILMELARVAADEMELRLVARQLKDEIQHRQVAEAKAHDAELGRLRAEAEAMRRRSANALVHLTGGVAHEFNNLFAGLMMLAESVRANRDNSPAVCDAMDTMLGCFDRGARLTHGMLSYSGTQYLAPEPLELSGLLESFAAVMRTAHGGMADIRVRVADDCAAVEVDKHQLLTVLAELLMNAREAATPVKARITVSAAMVTGGDGDQAAAQNAGDLARGSFVRIAVADAGPGMTPEILESACEPFFTTKKVGAGPGLGLSVAQGFARQSGGSLTVTSKRGAGTTVALYLPRAAEQQVSQAPRSAA